MSFLLIQTFFTTVIFIDTNKDPSLLPDTPISSWTDLVTGTNGFKGCLVLVLFISKHIVVDEQAIYFLSTNSPRMNSEARDTQETCANCMRKLQKCINSHYSTLGKEYLANFYYWIIFSPRLHQIIIFSLFLLFISSNFLFFSLFFVNHFPSIFWSFP